jgi:uncharacterized membrane protein
MARVHKSIEIKVPVNTVYSYLEEPKNAPEWITNMIEVKDVTGSGAGTHFNWTWNMAGIHMKGESTNIEDIPNKRIVLKGKGGIESTWTFNLESHKDVTVLDLDIDYTIPIPVLGKLAEKVVLKQNEREVDMAITNLKEKLETKA